MPWNETHTRERGFSLVELMVVIAIIGMLATAVTVALLQRAGQAKFERCKSDFQAIDTAVSMYELDTGRVPDSLDDLIQEPGGVSNWKGPYLKTRGVPKDPWNREYLFEPRGSRGGFEIRSLGADGADGGQEEDADISSYDVLQ